jgi:3-hydroxyacyl-CoA dehydrogenase
MLEIQTVAILGAGPDAVRTALLCSLAGLSVRVTEEDTAALDAAFRALRHEVERGVAEGLLGREERQRILDGILFTADADEAVTGADLAFVADAAEGGAAARLLAGIAPGCRATSLLATPFEPSAVSAALPQPGRVVELRLEAGDGALPRLTVRTAKGATDLAKGRAAAFAARLNRVSGEGR